MDTHIWLGDTKADEFENKAVEEGHVYRWGIPRRKALRECL